MAGKPAGSTARRSGAKAGKRGNDLPWTKMGHNGVHPSSTADTSAKRRAESGPRP